MKHIQTYIYKAVLTMMFIGLMIAPIFSQGTYQMNTIKQFIDTKKDKLELQPNDYKEFEIVNQYYDDNMKVTHIYLQQFHLGIPIEGAIMSLHLDPDGKLLHISNRFYKKLENRLANNNDVLSANSAVQKAAGYVGIKTPTLKVVEQGTNRVVFDKGEFALEDVLATKMYQMSDEGTIRLAWNVEIYQTDALHYWKAKIDATNGALLALEDWVISCDFNHKDGEAHANHKHTFTAKKEFDVNKFIPNFAVTNNTVNVYNVFDFPVESPAHGSRSLVFTNGDPLASPNGWHNDGITNQVITKGNNAFAYADYTPTGPAGPLTGPAPIPAVGGVPGQSGALVFDFPIDYSQNPQVYRDAAVTNLFYASNLIHDIFYHYGFTEKAGNFQVDNFGRGGVAGDALNAEAQDGSLVNNANMLTPTDGGAPRMQMYLWTNTPISLPFPGALLLDGDLDNGIILHEYGHGISIRSTGGPGTNCLSGDEQGGEGWSDYFAVMMTMDPLSVDDIDSIGRGVGTYVVGGDGIRPARYSRDMAINDYTYGDLTRAGISVPHGIGFIWCTVLWDMTWNLIDAYGYDPDLQNGVGGNNIAMQLVMDGLKLQPCSPTFVDSRDAILLADQIRYGGANQCLLWEAFAKRGLGFSANAGSNSRGDETAAFDVPNIDCTPVVLFKSEVSASTIQDGQNLTYTIEVKNSSASDVINGIVVTDVLPTGVNFVSASNGGTESAGVVTFPAFSLAPQTTKTLTITVTPNTGSTSILSYEDDFENGSNGFTAAPGANQWALTSADAFSGSNSLFAEDPDNFSNQTVDLAPITVGPGQYLRFAHRYNTEKTFDAGVLEISNDGGATYIDAGAFIIENSYTDFVPAANNHFLANKFAFGGSKGWHHSLVNLSAYNGQTIDIRFRLASDVLTPAEGWYVDDIQILTNPLTITNTATVTLPSGYTKSEEHQTLVLAANQAAKQNVAGDTELVEGNKNGLTVNMDIYPNPATDFIQLSIDENIDTDAQISIMNMNGQVVKNISYNGAAMPLRIETSKLPAGMYLLKVENKEVSSTQKFMITKK